MKTNKILSHLRASAFSKASRQREEKTPLVKGSSTLASLVKGRGTALAVVGFLSFSALPITDAYADNDYKVYTQSLSEYNECLSDSKFIPITSAKNILIDGSVDDWANYPDIALQDVRNYDGGEIDTSTNIRLAWDKNAFYMLAVTKDDTYCPQVGSLYWQGDCLQIAMGTADETYGDEFGVSYDTNTKQAYFTGAVDTTSVNAVVKRDGNNTIYEMSIPWNVHFKQIPDYFKLGVVQADNDGIGRQYVNMLATGIEERKLNKEFPYIILVDDNSTGCFSWIDGLDAIDNRQSVEYGVNVVNYGQEFTEQIKVDELGIDQTVTIPTKSHIRIPVTLSWDSPTTIDAKIDGMASHGFVFDKTIKVRATYETYSKRIEQLTTRIGIIEYLVNECKAANISTTYEEVNLNTMKLFKDYIIEDIANKDTDHMEYTFSCLENLYFQAFKNLAGYIRGAKMPLSVPKYITSDIKVVGSHLEADEVLCDGETCKRPIFLNGYGHGPYVLECISKLPGVGANYIQMENQPSSYIQPAGEIPEWLEGGGMRLEDGGNHYIHFPGTIAECVYVKPQTRYKLSFDAKGTGNEMWFSVVDWNNRTGLSLTNELKHYEYYVTGTDWAVFKLRFYINGDAYLDNVSLQEVDTSENVVDETNLVKNGDFEKLTFDSRFICDFSPIWQHFLFLKYAAENNIGVSFLMSPHYFPSWIWEKYPDSHATSIRTYDYTSDVIRDYLTTIGKSIASIMKNLPADVDLCVHNEDRFPIYDDDKFLPLMREKLKEFYHNDIKELNKAYGTNYSSFDDYVFPGRDAQNAQSYDVMVVTNEIVATCWEKVYEGIKEVWPESIVHGKFQSNVVLSPSNDYINDGIEPVSVGRLFDVNGMDGGNTYQGGAFALNSFSGSNPLSTMMVYDYLTTDNEKPVFNSEDHLDADNDTKDYSPSIAEHVSRYVWQSAVHGRAASAVWIWARPAPDDTSGAIGHVCTRPDEMAAIGKASLDSNRLSNEIVALQDSPRNVEILFSEASRCMDRTHLASLAKAYNAVAFSGVRSWILTDGMGQSFDKADILIIPNADYVLSETIDSIYNYIQNGKQVIIFGENSLKQNEHKLPNDEAKLDYIYSHATVVPTDVQDSDTNLSVNEYRDVIYPVLEQKGYTGIKIVDADSGELANNVEWISTEYNGKLLVNIADYNNYGETHRYKVYNNGVPVQNMFDLKTHTNWDGYFEITPSTPVLLQF